MPKINLSIPHQLSRDEARERVSRLIAEGRAQASDHISDVAETWNGYVDTFSFRARGFSIAGKLDVQPAQLVMELDLPFAAFPFKARIEQEMRERAQRLLA
jgi:hypothetical protein